MLIITELFVVKIGFASLFERGASSVHVEKADATAVEVYNWATI